MFSIRKRHKIQVLCNIDQYSSHPTGVPQDFHKATSSAIILKYAKAAQRAIQAT